MRREEGRHRKRKAPQARCRSRSDGASKLSQLAPRCCGVSAHVVSRTFPLLPGHRCVIFVDLALFPPEDGYWEDDAVTGYEQDRGYRQRCEAIRGGCSEEQIANRDYGDTDADKSPIVAVER